MLYVYTIHAVQKVTLLTIENAMQQSIIVTVLLIQNTYLPYHTLAEVSALETYRQYIVIITLILALSSLLLNQA